MGLYLTVLYGPIAMWPIVTGKFTDPRRRVEPYSCLTSSLLHFRPRTATSLYDILYSSPTHGPSQVMRPIAAAPPLLCTTRLLSTTTLVYKFRARQDPPTQRSMVTTYTPQSRQSDAAARHHRKIPQILEKHVPVLTNKDERRAITTQPRELDL